MLHFSIHVCIYVCRAIGIDYELEKVIVRGEDKVLSSGRDL
jgi:hypothetical protein